jgi:acetyltransferase-like isoleucine patch superfamily enzyme
MMRADQMVLMTLDRLMKGLRRRLRSWYYSRVLKSMGRGCRICDHVAIEEPHLVSLGDEVYLNDYVILQACSGSGILIGDRVGLSYGVLVLTGGLDLARGVDLYTHLSASVVIEDGVWIGARDQRGGDGEDRMQSHRVSMAAG